MKKEDKNYNKLLNIIKLFKNRPYHLTKYLLDNGAIDSNFLKKIDDSKHLDQIKLLPPHFNDINEMNNYFDSLLIDDINIEKDVQELTFKLNEKLDELIQKELYEEAINLRDYMLSKNIKRI